MANPLLYSPARAELSRAVTRARLRSLTPDQLRRLLNGAVFNANNPLFYDASIEAELNALTALLNSGFLEIYTGGQPALDGGLSGTLLVTLSFAATAFANATAAAGTVTATANTITNGTAVATGTAGYFALLASNNSTVIGTGSVGVSGADLNMSTTAIVSGAVVSCSSFSFTQAQT